MTFTNELDKAFPKAFQLCLLYEGCVSPVQELNTVWAKPCLAHQSHLTVFATVTTGAPVLLAS